MSNSSLMFPIIAALVSVGGIFIAIGVFKGRISSNTETAKAHTEEMKNLASKKELQDVAMRGDEQLAAAIKRSDEMLSLMTKRAEEDREKGQGQYREFYRLLTGHAERISVLELHREYIVKSLDDLKRDINGGFKDLRNDIKELRKQE